MQYQYCPLCGNLLSHKTLGDDQNVGWCRDCNRPFFAFSQPCVIVLAVNEQDEFAVIRQSYGDTDRFVLVAGFLQEHERCEDAAARELFEEIGLQATALAYLDSYAFPKRDTLMIGFAAKVKRTTFRLSSEVREARFMNETAARRALENSLIAKTVLDCYCTRRNTNALQFIPHTHTP